MPAYRDKKTNKWVVKYSYKNPLDGKFHGKTKRGFKTKKEALEWEINDKNKIHGNLDMNFGVFCELYLEKQKPRLKPSTYVMKKNIIDKHIVPYFSTQSVNDISTRDIMAWQTELLGKVDQDGKNIYKKSYLKTVHNQINAIFNFAVKYYDLPKNPAAACGNMGTDKDIEMSFWTKDQYMKFRKEMKSEPQFYYLFECLYWLGIREGEALALTAQDFDFDAKQVNITKTFYVLGGKQYITSPKTRKSIRKITMPDFLCEEIKEYLKLFYIPEDSSQQIFPTSKTSLNRALKWGIKRADLPEIRVHDLRHSHVSLLIHMGYSAVAIAERLGHESVHITYKYAHLFPSVQQDMAAKLNASIDEFSSL